MRSYSEDALPIMTALQTLFTSLLALCCGLVYPKIFRLIILLLFPAY